jgi:hypothetical protein
MGKESFIGGVVNMFDFLSSYKGNRIIVELTNGKQLIGTVIEVGPQGMRMETGRGTCIILISAIQAIWEKAPALAESMAVQDRQIHPRVEDARTQMIRPCAAPYGCFEQYNGQPCPQQYGHCPQRFAAPCFNYFYQ